MGLWTAVGLVQPGLQVVAAMRVAGRGQIVTVTSVGGAAGQPFADAYCAAAFAGAQDPRDAAATIVEAATTNQPKFRWQTWPGASAFAGVSLADLDGSHLTDQSATWIV